MTSEEKKLDIAKAVAKIVSGIGILTVKSQGRGSAVLASWFQQSGFEPPLLTLSIKKGRFIEELIQESKSFCLNILGDEHKKYLSHFGRGFKADQDPFEGIDFKIEKYGHPILLDSLAFLECELDRIVELYDHNLIIGKIGNGKLQSEEEEPMVHIRKNGFNY